MNRNAKIALAVGGFVVVGVGAFFIVKMLKRKKQEEISMDYSSSTSSSGGGSSSSSSSSSSPTSAQSNGVGCGGGFSYSGFPLKRGGCGREVYNLQKYLGIYQDGKFGRNTEKAVKNSQNLVSTTPIGWTAGYGKVSLSDYNQIANIPTSGSSSSSSGSSSSSSSVSSTAQDAISRGMADALDAQRERGKKLADDLYEILSGGASQYDKFMAVKTKYQNKAKETRKMAEIQWNENKGKYGGKTYRTSLKEKLGFYFPKANYLFPS